MTALLSYYAMYNEPSVISIMIAPCITRRSTMPLQHAASDHLAALPNCKMPFHWPRLDLDQVLCVRFKDDQQCLWSGGFKIEEVSSFHINMR